MKQKKRYKLPQHSYYRMTTQKREWVTLKEASDIEAHLETRCKVEAR